MRSTSVLYGCNSYDSSSLVIGSVLGSFKSLCQKVKAIDQKHGKFEMILASGDFFGPPDGSPEQTAELRALLDEQLEGTCQSAIW